MPKKRILFTNFHVSYAGGHDTFILHLANSLKGEYEILVACHESSSTYRACLKDSIAVKHCFFYPKARHPSWCLRAISDIRTIIEEFKPDIVHTNGGNDNSIVIWAYPFRRSFKLVRTHHAIKGIGRDPYHQWMYHRVVSASTYVSKTAMEINLSKGLHPQHAQLLENGVDIDRYTPRPKDSQLLSDLEIDQSEFIFGSSAGTADCKRVDLMIQAASILNDDFSFHVIVLGDPEKSTKLMQLAESLDVADRFSFPGYHEDTRPFVSLFDVGFILSDHSETISFASREMMAMGKPLLSSSFSGLKENVEHGIDGLLVEPGKVEAVVKAMKQFLTMDKKTRLEFSQNARKRAVDQFDGNQQIEGFRSLYKKLLLRE